tara:strand:+ start:184 stop:558 length:375 start_codon:yes stop_codon:yes gene_type:complete
MDIYYLTGITIAGILSGLLAGIIGGGAEIIIVPLLTLFGIFSSLKMRIGTTLFMLLPPVGLFAAIRYYKKGLVDLKAALYMGLLFTVFASVSSKYSSEMDSESLRKIFGFFTIIIGIYIYFSKE